MRWSAQCWSAQIFHRRPAALDNVDECHPHTRRPVPPAQPDQLLFLRRGEICTFPVVDVGLSHPTPQPRLRDCEIAGNLSHRPIPLAANSTARFLNLQVSQQASLHPFTEPSGSKPILERMEL